MTLCNLMLQRAQAEHLLSALCPLDDILIEPQLMGIPYPYPDEISVEQIPFAYSLVPYAPDMPQLSARLPQQRIAVLEAINKVKHLAILAPAGFGKSVTLAILASRFARQENTEAGHYTQYPLFIHALEILDCINDSATEIDSLSTALSNAYPGIDEAALHEHILTIISEKNAILLLDGMDELSLSAHERLLTWLNDIKKSRPGLSIVITLSPSNVSNILEAGFALMGLAGWRWESYQVWLKKWNTVWTRSQSTHLNNPDEKPAVKIEFLEKWLPEPGMRSPLEWTLQVWGAYSGDMTGRTFPESMIAYLQRVTATCFDMEKWASIAANLVSTDTTVLTSKMLSVAFSVRQRNKLKPEIENTETSQSKTVQSIPQNVSEFQYQIIRNGLVRPVGNSTFRFSNPLILAFLAGFGLPEQYVAGSSVNFPQWEIGSFTYGLFAVRTGQMKWFSTLIQPAKDDIYFPEAISTLINLPTVPRDWKNIFFKYLSDAISNETIHFSLRCRLLNFFWKDSAITAQKFFQFLLSSPLESVRRIALLGLLPYTTLQSVLEMVESKLNDPVASVRQTAMLVSGSSPRQSALETLMDILVSSSEIDRFSAAEAIANRSVDGYPVLKEAVQVDEIQVRRAGVFGLSQIRAAWSTEILRDLTTQDSEWIVKNAALQALEINIHSSMYLPVKQVHPSQAAWLIEFASQMGRGVPAGSFPLELLLQAAGSTNQAYVHHALYYLMHINDKNIEQALKTCLLHEYALIQDQAAFILLLYKFRGN